MEQHLGHRTYSLNLQHVVEQDPRVKSHEVEAQWVEVTYWNPRSIWMRLPLPKDLQCKLVGHQETIRGVRRTRPNALFFNTQVPALFMGTDLFRRPYVLSIDITPIQYDSMADTYGHRADHPGIAKDIKYNINRNIFQKATRLVPWSSWAAQSLIHDYGVSPEKIEVIPPGLDLAKWKPAPQKDVHNPARILFVGGDMERKGGSDLLAVFQSFPPNTAELILVTRAVIPDCYPNVRVIRNLQPNDPELIKLYQSSDLFVLPTRGEAFGISAVEASAAGLAIITTPVGGLPDIVVDGETGIFIEPGNREQLCNVLLLMLNNSELRKSLGHRARERAERCFDNQICAERILEITIQATRNS
jgi:glycosyltransferase involved in cell wall biosynthesis